MSMLFVMIYLITNLQTIGPSWLMISVYWYNMYQTFWPFYGIEIFINIDKLLTLSQQSIYFDWICITFLNCHRVLYLTLYSLSCWTTFATTWHPSFQVFTFDIPTLWPSATVLPEWCSVCNTVLFINTAGRSWS
jgi:hypothetical protein